MGIPTFLKKRRRKKELEKAVERGKELAKAGKVLVPTTTGFIEVPIGSKLATTAFPRGRGRGVPSREDVKRIVEQQRQAELKRIAEEKRRAEERRRQAEAAKKAAEEKKARERAQLVQRRAREVRELKKQAVKIEIRRKDIRPLKVTEPKFEFPTKVTRVDLAPKIDIGVEPSPKIVTEVPKDIKFQKRNIISRIENRAGKLADKVKGIFNVPEANFRGELLELSRITDSITPKEKEKLFITEKPKVKGGTIIKRRTNVGDANKGILPPKQELDLIVNDVFLNLSLGNITNAEAQKKLNKAEKNFVGRETSRVLPAQILTSFGLAAVGTAVAPVGVALKILATTEAARKRRQITRFALNNPNAAAKIFLANSVAALAGGGIAKSIQLKQVKLPPPTIKFKGKGKTTFTKQQIRTFDPKLEKLLKGKKITNTREFEIKIPNPRGKDIRIKIIEFQKNGKANFVGVEIINGKIVRNIRGTSLASDSKILTKVVSQSLKRSFRGLEKLRKFKSLKKFRKQSDAEISVFLEKFKADITAKSPLSRSILTRSETRLAKKFDLKKLSPDEFRQLIRSFLRIKGTRKNQPFTEAEFKAALRLSKSQILSRQKVIALKGVRQVGRIVKVGKKTVVQKIIRGVKIKGKKITFKKIRVIPKVRRGRVQITKARIRAEKIIIRTREEGIGLAKQLSRIPKKKTQFIEISGKKLKVPKAGKGRIKFIRDIKQRLDSRIAISNLRKVIVQTQKTTGKNILQKPQTSPAGVFKALARSTQKSLLRQFKKFGVIKASAKSLTLVPLTLQQRKVLNAQRSKLIRKLKKVLKQKNISAQQVISKQELSKISILGLAQAVKQAQKLKRVQQLIKGELIIDKPPFIIRQPTPIRVPVLLPGEKKRLRRKPKPKKKQQAFGVKIRPLKKKGARRKPKLKKVNISRLSQRNATRLRNTLLDETLARTGKIFPVKGKPQTPQLKVSAKPRSKKFRRFKKVKGRKVPLAKGKVIEKSKFINDSVGEKKKLTLLKKLAQLKKQSKKIRKINRVNVRTKNSKRRGNVVRVGSLNLKQSTQSLSFKQNRLRNLAKAREVRLSNLQKRNNLNRPFRSQGVTTSKPKRKQVNKVNNNSVRRTNNKPFRNQRTNQKVRVRKLIKPRPIIRPKRTLSPAQLKALADGRKTRLANLKKK